MIADRVIAVIASAKKIPPSTISVDSRLEDLGLDSLDLVEVVFRFEDEFDIRIDEKVQLTGATVADAIKLLEQMLPAESPGASRPAEA